MLSDEPHCSVCALAIRRFLRITQWDRHDTLLEIVGAHYSSRSFRRQLRRFGLRVVSMFVFIITQAGTRVFCRSFLARRFFFAFELLLILSEDTGGGHKILSILAIGRDTL
ncbi:MAG: hypothetical protein A07HR60_01199 [uncultured archaeon A07HR60]|nr:MAG: hypothetical protein A07HR60_01199 [uncultured archaeon A07HR60]